MSYSTAAPFAVDEPVTAAEPPRRPRPTRRPSAPNSRGTRLMPLWLLSPAGIVIIALTVVPIVFLLFTSFTDFNQRSLFTGQFDFVGLKQYEKVFTDRTFWESFLRTVFFTGAMVAASVVIGMGVSQLLGKVGGWLRWVLTFVLICAWAMPNVASSLVWGWMIEPGYGVVNWLLTQTHLFGNVTPVNWTSNTWLALTAIWALIVWQAVPFIGLTLYAAQTQVDPSYFEAARLDGASEWRIYWTITMQFLKPTLLLMTILSIIWDFNVFNQIWLISQGGPDNSTSTLGVYAYTQAFVGFDIGNGAAISMVTTLLLVVVTAFYIRSLVRAGEEL